MKEGTMNLPFPRFEYSEENYQIARQYMADVFDIRQLPDLPKEVLYKAFCFKADMGSAISFDDAVKEAAKRFNGKERKVA